RDETKLDPKRIPWSSLQKTKAGFLGLQVPVFDLVNPFHQHAEGPLETSLFFMKEWIRATRGDQKYTNQNIQNYGGVLIIQNEGSQIRVVSSLFNNHQFGTTGKARHQWHRTAGDRHFYAFYATIPGYIKPEDREKIHAAKELADKVGGDCRLLIEADWREAGHMARTVDPLIVIRKGDDIAYIDRFDCTAEELPLAREHAVKVSRGDA